MKKIISLLICIILIISTCITANAAGNSTLNAKSSAAVGGNVEFIVNVSGCGSVTSATVAVTHSDNLEFVSCAWLKSGSISTFDTATSKGTLGGLTSPDINGDLFKVIFKVKNISSKKGTVSVNVIANNDLKEIMNVTPSTSVEIVCATHNYGSYTKQNNTNHTRTCTICNTVETTEHTWDKGNITKAANCKEEGNILYTCTAIGCGEIKEETIKKTDIHTFDTWEQTKAPSCTKEGIESSKCSICNKETTKTINPTGHKIVEGIVTLEPTCTTEGKKEGLCETCGEQAEEVLPMKEHAYGKETITKEPSETQEGLKTSTCTICGNVKEESIPRIAVESEAQSNNSLINEEEEKLNNLLLNNVFWNLISIATILLVGGGIIITILIKKK